MTKKWRRRLALIGSAILLLFSSFISDLVKTLTETPVKDWAHSSVYYILVYFVATITVIFLWSWFETSEKDDIDELGEQFESEINRLGTKIDAGIKQINGNINQMSVNINSMIESINNLIKEIRQERNERNNPDTNKHDKV